ncbi:MAG: site-specific integrase [Lachnospiraceae bacterium]|nr:site-specific integrase [Lachnospiraceae bacterium]
MAGKRKDSKGRVLKTGESQRKNGSYDYRWTDQNGKMHSIYAKTLDELRNKESALQRDIADGIDYCAGEITVAAQVDKYMNLKRTVKQNSLRAYSSVVNRVHSDSFGKKRIRDVKKSDAQAWFIKLHDEGLARNTISVYKTVLQPAFEMAVDDDAIRKNPFRFNLSELLPDDSQKRVALTKSQQDKYLRFIAEYGNGNYLDDIIVLLETGVRISELYGITISDVDFAKGRLYIRRQLCRTAESPYFITSPKSASGIRTIPLSKTAYDALQHVITNRGTPQIETMVDGVSGFIFLDKDGKPKVAQHCENYMRLMQKKYRSIFSDNMPNVSPHVLRHTFCTNLQQGGLDPKSLQYVMGHSDPEITMALYTHSDYDFVEKAFRLALGT